MDIVKLEGIYVEGYGTIAKAVMQDRDLHVTAKAIYSYMSSFAGGSQSCFPTRSKMAYDLGINNKTLGKYLNQLIENGYIKVEQQKEKGRFDRNVYTILVSKFNSLKLGDNQNADNQNTAHQNTECQTLEYQQVATNNNSINNNNYNNIYVQNPESESEKQKAEKNFERFYKIYPKKKKRAKVLSWFVSHKPSDELVDQMIEAVKKQSNTIDWQKSGGKYIPHPYSWLNSGAWENEIQESELAHTSEKSNSYLLATELFERIRKKEYEPTAENKKLLKSWAVTIDEYLSLERTTEREDRVFYAIKQSTSNDYWKDKIVDAESLIKNISFIK